MITQVARLREPLVAPYVLHLFLLQASGLLEPNRLDFIFFCVEGSNSMSFIYYALSLPIKLSSRGQIDLKFVTPKRIT